MQRCATVAQLLTLNPPHFLVWPAIGEKPLRGDLVTQGILVAMGSWKQERMTKSSDAASSRWGSARLPGMVRSMAAKQSTSERKKRNTILIHSADVDLVRSLSILLQDDYEIVATDSPEHLAQYRDDKQVSMLVVDLEKSVPELLAEFEERRQHKSTAPIIVLYAFRQAKPQWEKAIRALVNQLLYKPVPIEQILNAIAIEERLHISASAPRTIV